MDSGGDAGIRLRLDRPLQQEDFATVYAWENMEELWDVSDQKGPFSPSEIKDFMERCLNPENDDCERWIISSNRLVRSTYST